MRFVTCSGVVVDVESMAGSERLVDYFVVAAFDRSPSGHAARKKSGHAPGGNGKIVQRFPTQDWKDVPFISESKEHRVQADHGSA